MISSEVIEQDPESATQRRFERYRAKADPAIAIISAFYLVLLLMPRVAITSLESSRAIFALDIVFWMLIATDLIYRIVLATNRRDRFLRIGALILLCSGFLVFFRHSDTTRDLVRLALIAVVAIRAINSVRYFFKLRSVFFIASAVVLIVLAFGVSMTATRRRDTQTRTSTPSATGSGGQFRRSPPLAMGTNFP